MHTIKHTLLWLLAACALLGQAAAASSGSSLIDEHTLDKLDTYFVSRLKFDMRHEPKERQCASLAQLVALKLQEARGGDAQVHDARVLLVELAKLLAARHSRVLAEFVSECAGSVVETSIDEMRAHDAQLERDLEAARQRLRDEAAAAGTTGGADTEQSWRSKYEQAREEQREQQRTMRDLERRLLDSETARQKLSEQSQLALRRVDELTRQVDTKSACAAANRGELDNCRNDLRAARNELDTCRSNKPATLANAHDECDTHKKLALQLRRNEAACREDVARRDLVCATSVRQLRDINDKCDSQRREAETLVEMANERFDKLYARALACEQRMRPHARQIYVSG